MADYRMPMDDDGVKYHGVVDEDGQYPGQVLYGLDKNGRLKPVNVDDEGNVLTRVTGSNVEEGILIRPNKDFIVVNLSGDNLEPNKDMVFDVYANKNEIWTLMRLGYNTSRQTDASGRQLIWLYHGEGTTPDRFIMSIEGNANQYLRGTIPGRREEGAGGEIIPISSFEMVEAIRNTTILSDRLPLRIRYRNLSDKPIDFIRLRLYFKTEKVGAENG